MSPKAYEKTDIWKQAKGWKVLPLSCTVTSWGICLKEWELKKERLKFKCDKPTEALKINI